MINEEYRFHTHYNIGSVEAVKVVLLAALVFVAVAVSVGAGVAYFGILDSIFTIALASFLSGAVVSIFVTRHIARRYVQSAEETAAELRANRAQETNKQLARMLQAQSQAPTSKGANK